jgi:hypothetical protein
MIRKIDKPILGTRFCTGLLRIVISRDEDGQSKKKMKFCESRHHRAGKITKIRK